MRDQIHLLESAVAIPYGAWPWYNNSIPTKNKSSEIVAPEPVREVLAADVISDAPGVSEGGGKTCAMNS